MASKKIRDIVVKVGEYTDRNSGQSKGKFENVGALMQGDDDNFFIMLKRTFNPAGVPGQDARESLLLSCYVPQDQRENGGGQQKRGGYDQSPGPGAGQDQGGKSDIDDEIPF